MILTGDTSGTITLSAPLVAGSNTVTLPAQTGTLQMLSQGTAIASTSGTAIDFTGIPAWAKKITVMFSGVSTSGTTNMLIQLGSSTITKTGYVGVGTSYNTTAITTTNYTSGFGIGSSNQATATLTYGHCIFVNVSANLWVGNGMFGLSTSTSHVTAGGLPTLANVLDRVRITTTNGTDTFDAGTINILYEG